VKRKLAFAIALGNLYHFDVEKIPGFLIGGVLASAHLIAHNKLKEKVLENITRFISNKTIINFYTTAVEVFLLLILPVFFARKIKT
jgi:hypothetical protein